MDDDSKAHARR